ncbi:5-(carboxyamino)imidazole ribonucleotide mutase [Alphaproteobacteria bacterium]|jgi:5-(carboxyamino)imidazole ribonucleotide mutase|nr:5-(carboxyamino)imidazole ribonucleotide mutase [Alphaproteobacteria bacterium]MDC3150214.1 5-(carboxyamino)imidazole ribonucleotide mutase [Alphaproteobacteria bacterium]MDC3173144.1 5-(carboxyamino)imidazole ribonucleotide mutase [Alphaproteobacteria bacterium]|tara:strand:+ start:164 stop:652 length:489 start_codon:yes stop_codon:yes gene_type:complete
MKLSNPKISIVMGSQSDWSTLKHTSTVLKELKISHEKKIVSAHRTPKRLYEYAEQAYDKGIKIIIAGAGGSAHLPGMIAAITHIPVIGVPIESKTLKGLDSLLSIAQMPFGVPVGTVAIGENGAKNAALYAASIISNYDSKVENQLIKWRLAQTKKVKKTPK